MTLNNDNFFVWARFRAYFKKTIKEHWKSNLTLIVLMFAAILIVVMWTAMQSYSGYYVPLNGDKQIWPDPMYDMMHVIMFMFLYVCGSLWSARMMRGFKNKGSRIFILTTPVTQFEAWLTRWIIHVPCFLVVFAVEIVAADLIRVAVFSPIVTYAKVEMFCPEWSNAVSMFLLFYFLTSSLYALGSVFFPRRPVLMTSIVLFFAGFIYAIVSFFVTASVILDGIDFNQPIVCNLFRAYMAASTLFCWWLSYRRFKELEIIDRM